MLCLCWQFVKDEFDAFTLAALIPSRSGVSFDDLLLLSTEVESLLGMPHDDELSMVRAFLLPLASPKATLPLA